MCGFVMTLLEQIQKDRQQQWIHDWYEGLANCRNCDGDYIKSERLKNMNNELLCPKCLKPEDKTYYYCEDHGQTQCRECDHNVG